MRTANMKIYVKKGTVSMKVNGEKIVFKVLEELQSPQDDLECFNVCMIQGVTENTFQDHQINPLEATLAHSVIRKDKEPVVVTGIAPILGFEASILFDSRATHSFISFYISKMV